LAVALNAMLTSIPNPKKVFTGLCLIVTLAIFLVSAIPAYTGIAATYNSDPELHRNVLNFKLDKYYLKEFNQPLAEKIERMYAEGDTVIYNDWNTAQSINLFLRNSGKPIVQKVEAGPEHKVSFFEKASGLYTVISETEK